MTTPDWLERTSLLMGPDKMERFRRAHVLVVGTGGVGAYAAEMLVRAGIGRLTLLDADRVQPSNINRQLCALHSTVGEEKVRVLGLRFKDINPELDLTVRSRGENGYHPNPFCRLVGNVSLRAEQSCADTAEKRRYASSVTGGVLRPAGRPGRFGPSRGRTE